MADSTDTQPAAAPTAAAAAPIDQRPPVDVEWLTRMRTTKPDFLRRLFEVFLAEEPKRVASLRKAISQGDTEMIRYLAHSLKGAAATLGMERVRDACRELEFAAREGDPARFAAFHQCISAEMDAVYAVIRENMPPGP